MKLSNSLKALKANKVKTTLLYLSLVVTISSIFLISSISHGIISMYSTMLKNDGDIIITQAKISDTFFSDVDAKLLTKIDTINGVKKAGAMIVGAGPVEQLPIVAIYGISKNLHHKYDLESGFYPQKNEVIIGQSIYNQLINKKQIAIANKTFKISGVYKSKIGFENGGVVMNLNDAGKIFHKSASIILVNINFDANIDAIIYKIQKIDDNIEVSSTNSFVTNYNQFKIINKSSFIISLVAFIMGLIAIASIMSITVLQRKDEFGIMKALGISSRKITISILCEALILGIFSYISALLISSLLLFFIKNIDTLQGYVNGDITFTLSIYIFLTTLFMLILGSLVPVYTALKVDPITLLHRGN